MYISKMRNGEREREREREWVGKRVDIGCKTYFIL